MMGMGYRLRCRLWLYFLCCLVVGCSGDIGNSISTSDAFVRLAIDYNGAMVTSKALGDPVSAVNRILVMPFQKVNPVLPDDQADNFMPMDYMAQQWDIASFPASGITLRLPSSFTYRLLVIGYNQNDYDFYTPAAPGNRFSIGSSASPAHWNNFQLLLSAPNSVPEFFICPAKTDQDVITFTPETEVTLNLTGTLRRIVSGLSVTVTGIPGYVESISLVAERMVKAIHPADTTAASVQTDGDGENRMIRKLAPNSGQVVFEEFLLPTLTTYSSRFYLDVKYGSTTERYTIKIPDSGISNNNSITLMPNQVVRISGDYSQINFGFEMSWHIDLDDDIWDGIP